MARRKRPARSPSVLRWLAVAGVMLVAFLYYRPLKTYIETRHALAQRSAEVRSLEAQRQALERRLAVSESGAALAHEARRLGLVKPGERLFIVKGIVRWRHAQRRARLGSG